MFFLSVADPNLYKFVLLGLIIIALGILLRYFRQPYIVAYIIAGVLMGEHGFNIITDKVLITAMGEFGLILLLFFIGMETSLLHLLKKWKLAIMGTSIQVLASVLLVGLLGYVFHWEFSRIITLGFVISLSSSAVVIKLLQDNKETQSAIGQNVISILLMQDILIVPMLIATNFLGTNIPSTEDIILQIVGGVLIVGGIIWVVKKKEVRLPFSDLFEEDHELQVFAAFLICFGFALITALFGLSAALGAFVGGIVIHSSPSAQWFHDSLHSFRVIFVALFFVSIGMLIDINFLIEHWKIIALFIPAIYITNHFINTLVLRLFGVDWKSSWYGGALLAQIGELSFVLAASSFHANIISDFTYQLTIVIIALTLLISPFWIGGTKRLVGLNVSMT